MAKKKLVKKNGRPTIYTDELAIEICDRFSKGELILTICEDEHMPTSATIYDWADKDSPRFIESFSEMFLRAKLKAGHSHADKSLNVLDKSLAELKTYDPALASAYASLIRHKSNAHARTAGYHNRHYNAKAQVEETKQTDADIEI